MEEIPRAIRHGTGPTRRGNIMKYKNMLAAFATSLALGAADAYRNYRAAQHALRLAAQTDGGPARVPDAQFRPERDVVRATWAHLFYA